MKNFPRSVGLSHESHVYNLYALFLYTRPTVTEQFHALSPIGEYVNGTYNVRQRNHLSVKLD